MKTRPALGEIRGVFVNANYNADKFVYITKVLYICIVKLNDMNWNEIKRLAIKHGFRFVGHGKKHDEYRNDETGKTIQIERHWSQEVRKGLMTRLKKDIGF